VTLTTYKKHKKELHLATFTVAEYSNLEVLGRRPHKEINPIAAQATKKGVKSSSQRKSTKKPVITMTLREAQEAITLKRTDRPCPLNNRPDLKTKTMRHRP
jgi:hypothetical protein